MKYILVGDLGGTKTILALFPVGNSSSSSAPRSSSVINDSRAEEEYPSRDYGAFNEIVRNFISKNSISPGSIKQAVFGIAGPVLGGRSKLTNLQWELEEEELASDLELQGVKLLNDLQATATYIPHLKAEESETIYKGEGKPPAADVGEAAAAVIAPGTGLGEAYLTWDPQGRIHAHASEGGHCDFASSSDIEDGLLQYLREKHKHVSYELVCSAKGIYNTWTYFHEVAGSSARYACQTYTRVANSEDPAPIIIDSVLKEGNECRPCVKSVDTFVSVLGEEAGNLALKFLATKGVFIAGGIAKEALPALASERFGRAYTRKGRMSGLVSRIPVTAVLTHRSALLGAAHYALDLLSGAGGGATAATTTPGARRSRARYGEPQVGFCKRRPARGN